MQAGGESTNIVLVIEDDFAIRDMLTQMLEDAGYQAVGAANGLEALHWLQQSHARPCLILLDLMMPVMTGWEFRTIQQADTRLASIPVVVLSADRQLADVEAAAYMKKPIELRALYEILERYGCRNPTHSSDKPQGSDVRRPL